MASSNDEGEVYTDSDSEQKVKLKKSRLQDADSPNIGEEEEARLRAVLLARQAEKRERSEKSSKKSDRHHMHKKKKRRREEDNSPLSDDQMKSTKMTTIEKAIITTSDQNKDDECEIGLNIQPPQQLAAAASSTDSAHRRKHRKKEKRKSDESISREKKDDREDKYGRDYEADKRKKRIQDGWTNWKNSLHNTGSKSSSSRSVSTEVKPYQQMGERERRSERPENSSSRRREDQPKIREDFYWNRDSSSHKGDRSRRSPYRPTTTGDSHKRYHQETRWLPQVTGRKEVEKIEKIQTTTTTSKSSVESKSDGKTHKIKKEQTHIHSTVVVEQSRSLSPSPEPSSSTSKVPLEGATELDTPTQDEIEDKKDVLSEVSKSGSTASDSNGSASSSSSDTDDEGSMKSKERRNEHGGEMKKNKTKKYYSKFDSTPNEDDKSTDDEVDNQARIEPEDSGEKLIRGDVSDMEDDEDAKALSDNNHETEPISPDAEQNDVEKEPDLPVYYPATMGCRHVDEFECLNKIEEGTYGVVYRAKEKRTDDVVALKRLKMEKEKEGFPITSLREINMLLKAGNHPNIVNVREIVVGSNMDKIYLVMDYIEHDLKSLMETMKQGFLVGEVKTLMQQLLAGVHHLHDNWILHRDLKTSNLLLSHQGVLKIGDFGLAREYGSPLKPYTPIVVTLWYRAPELLLGIKEYSTPIDIWSVGCIFAELLTLKPLFTGKSEIEQLNKIFKLLGTPNAKIWQGYDELPGPKKVQFCEYPYNSLRKHFGATLSDKGFNLMNKLLTYDPVKRIDAKTALDDPWFKEEPRPVSTDMFPTWPAKSELSKTVVRKSSPKAPSGGKQYKQDPDDLLLRLKHGQSTASSGFSLKFDAPKFK